MIKLKDILLESDKDRFKNLYLHQYRTRWSPEKWKEHLSKVEKLKMRDPYQNRKYSNFPQNKDEWTIDDWNIYLARIQGDPSLKTDPSKEFNLKSRDEWTAEDWSNYHSSLGVPPKKIKPKIRKSSSKFNKVRDILRRFLKSK